MLKGGTYSWLKCSHVSKLGDHVDRWWSHWPDTETGLGYIEPKVSSRQLAHLFMAQ